MPRGPQAGVTPSPSQAGAVPPSSAAPPPPPTSSSSSASSASRASRSPQLAFYNRRASAAELKHHHHHHHQHHPTPTASSGFARASTASPASTASSASGSERHHFYASSAATFSSSSQSPRNTGFDSGASSSHTSPPTNVSLSAILAADKGAANAAAAYASSLGTSTKHLNPSGWSAGTSPASSHFPHPAPTLADLAIAASSRGNSPRQHRTGSIDMAHGPSPAVGYMGVGPGPMHGVREESGSTALYGTGMAGPSRSTPEPQVDRHRAVSPGSSNGAMGGPGTKSRRTSPGGSKVMMDERDDVALGRSGWATSNSSSSSGGGGGSGNVSAGMAPGSSSSASTASTARAQNHIPASGASSVAPPAAPARTSPRAAFAAAAPPGRPSAAATSSPPSPRLDLATYPAQDLLRVLAALLHQIATANDELRPSSGSGGDRKRGGSKRSKDGTGSGGNGTPTGEGSGTNSPRVGLAREAGGRGITSAAWTALSTPSSTLCFHARNVPSISIESYLLRILKYCPTTNEVFLSLLVYFDRMSRMGTGAERGDSGHGSPAGRAAGLPAAAAAGGEGESYESGRVGTTNVSGLGSDGSSMPFAPVEAEPHPGMRGFAIDSYNVHRLVIAGVTVASKFFSDVFYTNSRYAKVGGLPVHELNQLELQFLLLNDFSLMIPLEEMQRYADQLLIYGSGQQALGIGAGRTRELGAPAQTSGGANSAAAAAAQNEGKERNDDRAPAQVVQQQQQQQEERSRSTSADTHMRDA